MNYKDSGNNKITNHTLTETQGVWNDVKNITDPNEKYLRALSLEAEIARLLKYKMSPNNLKFFKTVHEKLMSIIHNHHFEPNFGIEISDTESEADSSAKVKAVKDKETSDHIEELNKMKINILQRIKISFKAFKAKNSNFDLNAVFAVVKEHLGVGITKFSSPNAIITTDNYLEIDRLAELKMIGKKKAEQVEINKILVAKLDLIKSTSINEIIKGKIIHERTMLMFVRMSAVLTRVLCRLGGAFVEEPEEEFEQLLFILIRTFLVQTPLEDINETMTFDLSSLLTKFDDDRVKPFMESCMDLAHCYRRPLTITASQMAETIRYLELSIKPKNRGVLEWMLENEKAKKEAQEALNDSEEEDSVDDVKARMCNITTSFKELVAANPATVTPQPEEAEASPATPLDSVVTLVKSKK